MAETRIVFQTIKLGDSGKIYVDMQDNSPKQYYSHTRSRYNAILLADVKPFCIIGGHVTTNITEYEKVSLLGVRLQGNKRSIPVIKDFQPAINGFQDSDVYNFESLNYIALTRKMSGYHYEQSQGMNEAITQTSESENITHLYLVFKENDLRLDSHSMVSMTLVLEKDPERIDFDRPIG